ncbi:MAG: hypothetical protein JXJ20_13915 [Anaerolineae bacterium]|nr:hypothetical protein [Anaerolineae bacterium]
MNKRLCMLTALAAVLALSTVTALAAPAGSPNRQSDGYRFLFAWGSEGGGDGQFNFPRAIAIGPDGNVYVADSENHRVQVFSPDGAFITRWGSYGSGPGQFDIPQGIAVDGQGNVYVGDRNNSRIQRFTADGTFVTAWGSYGTGNGQFVEPRNVAVDGQGNVYVADSQNHRIQKFSSDGAFITTWGSQGGGDGQFNYATGVAVDVEGNVYVSDADNHRIQKFTSDGAFITTWGSQGGGDGQFDRPYSLSVDAAGDVYVIDEWNNRVQKFTSDGAFITMWGGPGSDEGQFQYPHGVAVDARGYAYVVDEWNHRVQVFEPVGEADQPAPQADSVESPTPAPAVQQSPAELVTPQVVMTPLFDEPVASFDLLLIGQQGDVLYFEDFQDNIADKWALEADWTISQDPTGNYVLSGTGPGRADIDGTWEDLYLRCRVQIIDGWLIVAYRPAEGTLVHAFRLSPAGIGLYLRDYPDSAVLQVQNDTPLPVGTWLDVVIASNGAQIQAYVDDTLWIDFVSADLPPLGTVGFLGPDAGEVWLDDVTIRALRP